MIAIGKNCCYSSSEHPRVMIHTTQKYTPFTTMRSLFVVLSTYMYRKKVPKIKSQETLAFEIAKNSILTKQKNTRAHFSYFCVMKGRLKCMCSTIKSKKV